MNDISYSKQWKQQSSLLAGFLLLLVIFYYPTFASMVSVWIRSETFTHGFIILPICGWLIWRIRDEIAATKPQVNYLGIPALIVLGFIWLISNYVGVSASEQLAATLMIPVLVFTLLGWQTCSVMTFPLLFIFFAVPLGEEFTPALINLTADFTVAMIELAGIPVYREGTFFQLPTGSWSVVAACSGVRYLIASVTLGSLYAYLNYNSSRKRTIFILAACIIPIVANVLRAFMIVMIGHFSGMELATGVDHLIYGWVFFGIVIFIMFYIGSFWRDEESEITRSSVKWQLGSLGNRKLIHKLLLLSTVCILLFWPMKIYWQQQPLDFSQVADIQLVTPSGWSEVPTASNAWIPAYQGLDRELLKSYENSAGERITLFIGYYAKQRQDAELGNYSNVLVVQDDARWRAITQLPLDFSNIGINASSARIKSHTEQHLTSYFFYVDGQWATNKYETKWLQLKAQLLGGRNDGAIIALTTSLQESEKTATDLLKRFVADGSSNIKVSLDNM